MTLVHTSLVLLMLESVASACSSHGDSRSSRVISLCINKKNEREVK